MQKMLGRVGAGMLRLGTRRWGRVLAVVIVCCFSFFVYLQAPGVSLMEARNFVAAREMAGGGSWLIPTMNGALRLAKPPLPTWAVATAMRVFHTTTNLFVLRLPAALMASLLIFFFWGLVRELTRPQESQLPPDPDAGRTAWLAALVLASSVLLLTTGRDGQWDIFANSFMLAALWWLTRGLNNAGSAYGWFVAAGLAVGASVLSKGPVALYAVLVPYVGCYASRLNPCRADVGRQWRGLLLMLVVGLGVGLAWPAYILTHVPAAALAVARVETTAWQQRHVQPPWYYLSFPVFAGFWLILALAVLAVPYARRRVAPFAPYLFGLGWFVAALVLLSLVPEKKVRYMLPLMPPLALLIAGLLRYLESAATAAALQRADRRLLRVWSGLLVVVCVAVPVGMAVVPLAGFGVLTGRFLAAVLVLGCVALAAFWCGARGLRPVVLMAASLTLLGAMITLLLPAYPLWESRRDEAGLTHLRDVQARLALRGLPWFSVGELGVTQVWAAGHAIPTWQPDTAVAPKLPLVLLSGTPYTAAQLPKRWQTRIAVAPPDSFYLGRKKDSGLCFYTVLTVK